MADAVITLKLAQFDEAFGKLRALHQELSSMQSPGGAGAISNTVAANVPFAMSQNPTAGVIAASPGPPPPIVQAQNMTPASASAGTVNAASHAAGPILQAQAGGPPQAGPMALGGQIAPGGQMALGAGSALQLIMANAAYGQLMSAAGQAATQIGQAQAAGRPFTGNTLPSMLAPGIGGLLGGLIGLIGGPGGAMVGGSIGAGIGGILGDFLAPGEQQAESLAALNRSPYLRPGQRYLPGMTQAMLDVVGASQAAGMPIGPALAAQIAGVHIAASPAHIGGGLVPHGYVPAIRGVEIPGIVAPEKEAAYSTDYNAARYSPQTIRNMGFPSDGRTTRMQRIRQLLYGADSDPFAALSALTLDRSLGAAGELAKEKIREEITASAQISGGEEINRAQMQVEQARGDPHGLANRLRGQGALLRLKAAKTKMDPSDRQALTEQAKALDYTASGIEIDEAKGRDAADFQLQMGRASRGLATGATSDPSVFGRVAGTRERQLHADIARREKAGLYVSPAMRTEYQEEIENTKYQAVVQEQAYRTSQLNASAALTGAQAYAAAAPIIYLGSAAVAPTAAGRASLLDVNAQRAALHAQLSSMQISAPERTALQAQLAMLDVKAQQASAQAAAGAVTGQYQVTMTGISEGALPAQLALMRGAEGSAPSFALYQSAAAGTKAARAALQHLRAQGFSNDSQEALQARQQIMQGQLAEQQAQNTMAAPQASGQTRAAMTRLDAMAAFAESGYGGSREMQRGIITREMGLVHSELQRLAGNREHLRGAHLWTDEMEATYAQNQSALALKGLGLQQQYDQGFVGRMLSFSLGMPSRGGLAMAGFTHMEGSFQSVRSSLFGGSAEDSRRWRTVAPTRFLQELGADTGMGAATRGLVSSEKGAVDVNVNVRVTDQRGKPLESSQSVVKHQATLDSRGPNASATRPTG